MQGWLVADDGQSFTVRHPTGAATYKRGDRVVSRADATDVREIRDFGNFGVVLVRNVEGRERTRTVRWDTLRFSFLPPPAPGGVTVPAPAPTVDTSGPPTHPSQRDTAPADSRLPPSGVSPVAASTPAVPPAGPIVVTIDLAPGPSAETARTLASAALLLSQTLAKAVDLADRVLPQVANYSARIADNTSAVWALRSAIARFTKRVADRAPDPSAPHRGTMNEVHDSPPASVPEESDHPSLRPAASG